MASANTNTVDPNPMSEREAAGCCGGPAPAGTSGCCARDAEVKASGGSGCGCGTVAAAPKPAASGCCAR
jgi:hypothetical protein